MTRTEASRIVPATVAAVTSVVIAKASGKFVRFHASTNPSRLNGAGSEKALPSTACACVLNAVVSVTYSGMSTVIAHSPMMMVPGQLTRSIRKPPGGLGRASLEDLRRLDGLDDECGLNRHQSTFLPRVRTSWSRAIATVMTKKIVALAIW